MARPHYRVVSEDHERSRPIVEAHGLIVVVPSGWEVRLRRSLDDGEGVVSYPVVHAATVPLPPDRGDYGSNVVESLGTHDVFVSLVEFGEEAVDTDLFPKVEAFPETIDASGFHPRQVQRLIPGQAGQQVFFTFGGRAFCLYVVLGSYAMVNQVLPTVEGLLAGIAIAPSS
jgi:hypothetical protein